MTTGAIVDFAPLFAQTHGPALITVIPLMAAALAAIIPSARAGWGIALASAVAVALISVVMLAVVWTSAPLSYPMGDWPVPIGIEYRIDRLNAAFVLLVSVMAVLALIYAPESVREQIPEPQRSLFYSAFLVCVAGLIGVAATGDAFNLFVFLEISSLSTYVLVAMGAHQDRRALTAAYNYLVLGTIGATFFVIGVGFLYMATGTLNMGDMAERLRELSDQSTVRAGFAFIVIGLGLKLAMFPLHTWLPNAYAFAPSFVTVFLASTATKVAFYALVRFLYTVFGPAFTFQGSTLVWLLAPLAVLGMIAASFQAVFQNDARRLLALSSVAQVGYMLLGLSMGTAAGLAAGLLHLFNHAVMKGALFMALGATTARMGVVRVSEFAGLGRVMPLTMIAFAIGGLSLIGVPLTLGWVSKMYLLEAALDRGWWWAAAAIAFSSVLALVYVGRMLEAAFLRPPPQREGEPARRVIAPWSMAIPMWILAAACIWFGVNADFSTSIACRAATALFAEDLCVSAGGVP